MEKVHDMFYTLITIQIISFVFLSWLGVGINQNITYDFPVIENFTLLNVLTSVWSGIKFIVVTIFFSFLNYDTWILININLFFSILTWVTILLIILDAIDKANPIG